MKQPKIAKRLLCLSLASLLALSLAACNSTTNEQNSAQPIPSTQPTAAPTPTPTPPIPFTDVAEDSPYYDAVVWAYENGIASDGETFGPTDTHPWASHDIPVAGERLPRTPGNGKSVQ